MLCEAVSQGAPVRERILHATADPNVAFLLLIAGTLAVYFEFTSPGLILPGVAGGVLALLGLSALAALPISGAGAALLLMGGAALLLEVKLEARYTSRGILFLSGTCAMVWGALHLIDGPPEVRIHLSTALAAVPPFGAVSAFLGTLAFRARRNKTMVGGR
jgi:membrane-bound serine protease (ClpP class)